MDSPTNWSDFYVSSNNLHFKILSWLKKFLQSSQKSETSRSNLKRAYIYFLVGCLRIPTDDLIASIVLNFPFFTIELPKMSTDIQSDCCSILRESAETAKKCCRLFFAWFYLWPDHSNYVTKYSRSFNEMVDNLSIGSKTVIISFHIEALNYI